MTFEDRLQAARAARAATEAEQASADDGERSAVEAARIAARRLVDDVVAAGKALQGVPPWSEPDQIGSTVTMQLNRAPKGSTVHTARKVASIDPQFQGDPRFRALGSYVYADFSAQYAGFRRKEVRFEFVGWSFDLGGGSYQQRRASVIAATGAVTFGVSVLVAGGRGGRFSPAELAEWGRTSWPSGSNSEESWYGGTIEAAAVMEDFLDLVSRFIAAH